MNFKISLLSIVIMAMPVCMEAQTARNPLNLEPARVTLQKRVSSWKLTEEIFYHADNTQFDKRSIVYDENGRRAADIIQSWNKNDKTWQITTQTEYHCNNGIPAVAKGSNNGRDAVANEVVITKSNGQYKSKTEITPGSDSKPAYSQTYLWNKDSDDWHLHPSQRSVWEYNDNGQVTTCLKQNKKTNSNEWNNYYARILYMYNESGALIEEIYQTWNPELEQWINAGKYSYSKESEQKETAVSYFFASDRWIFDGKTVYIYDNDGKIVRSEHFRNNTDESLTVYSLFTYSEGKNCPVIIEPKEVNIYPNPAVSSFELTVPDVFFGKNAILFDVSGKQVKTIPVINGKTQVDVNGLSGGVYLLTIADITKKVIVQ